MKKILTTGTPPSPQQEANCAAKLDQVASILSAAGEGDLQ
jgi:hypothetical protein